MSRAKTTIRLAEKMDRKIAVVSSFFDHEQAENELMAKMDFNDKSRLITYLREAQYGHKATTGRLPRIYRIAKLK